MQRRLELAVAALAATLGAPPVAAQGGGTLSLSAGVQDLAPGASGGSAGLEWLRPVGARAQLNLGVLGSSIADTRWRYGRLGGSLQLGEGTWLHAQLDLGRGSNPDETRFSYQIYRAGATRQLVAGRLYLEAEEQYVRVADSRGHIVKLGGALTASSTLSARLAYHFSLGSQLDASYVSARLDREGSPALLAGVVVGRSRSGVLGLFGEPEAQRSWELFGGVRVRRDAHELALILDLLSVAEVEKRSLTLVYRVQL